MSLRFSRAHKSRRARRPLALLAGLLFALLAIAPSAGAADPFSGSKGNGRIYDPNHVRSQPAKIAPGRLMKEPKIPDPPNQRPLRSSAVIPDPSPQLRGGSGFKRNGQYFYADAQPATLTRKSPDAPRHETIPNPEAPVPRHHTSAAEHMPGMSNH